MPSLPQIQMAALSAAAPAAALRRATPPRQNLSPAPMHRRWSAPAAVLASSAGGEDAAAQLAAQVAAVAGPPGAGKIEERAAPAPAPVVAATAAPALPTSILASTASALGILYRFSRPHTMLGTTISIMSVSALALTRATASHPAALAAVATALATALLMNVAIVGVNQVYDVPIDALNKPGLPLPAGDLSVRGAITICVVAAAASLALGALWGTPALLATLGGSLALGLAYSVDAPGLRWKRHPALAAACILAVRAVGVQAGFFAHVRSALAASGVSVVSSTTSTSPTTPPALAFAVTAMLAFSLAIAVLKDTPDVAGDARAGLRTLSVRAGAPAVFKGAVGALSACYALAIGWTLAACTSPATRAIAAGGHALAAAFLARTAAATDPTNKASLDSAYMRLWALFYFEYLLIPFVR